MLGYLKYFEKTHYWRPDSCFVYTRNDISEFSQNECLKKDNKKKNYLLFGDSHAAHIWFALNENNKDIHFLQATGAGCMPLLEKKFLINQRCRQLTDFIFDDYLQNNRLSGIVLAARWNKKHIQNLLTTAKMLAKVTKRVVVLGPIVEYKQPLPRLIAISQYALYRGFVDVNRKKKQKKIDEILKREFRKLVLLCRCDKNE